MVITETIWTNPHIGLGLQSPLPSAIIAKKRVRCPCDRGFAGQASSLADGVEALQGDPMGHYNLLILKKEGARDHL
jgi:hypothetical protein